MSDKFWTDKTFEPKRNFSWEVAILDDKGASIFPSFYAKSVAKPNFAVEMKEYNLINRKIKQPSNVVWGPIDLTVIDDVNSTVMKFLSDYLKSANYDDIDKESGSSIGIDTTSKLGAATKMGKVTITQFDSEGQMSERWTLRNPQISAFASEALDYSSEELSTYTFTIAYDWADLETTQEDLMQDETSFVSNRSTTRGNLRRNNNVSGVRNPVGQSSSRLPVVNRDRLRGERNLNTNRNRNN